MIIRRLGGKSVLFGITYDDAAIAAFGYVLFEDTVAPTSVAVNVVRVFSFPFAAAVTVMCGVPFDTAVVVARGVDFVAFNVAAAAANAGVSHSRDVPAVALLLLIVPVLFNRAAEGIAPRAPNNVALNAAAAADDEAAAAATAPAPVILCC